MSLDKKKLLSWKLHCRKVIKYSCPNLTLKDILKYFRRIKISKKNICLVHVNDSFITAVPRTLLMENYWNFKIS